MPGSTVSRVLEGQATDLEIEARHILRMRDQLYDIYAHNTGKSKDVIAEDCERNYWLSSKDMLAYGLVDKVIEPYAYVLQGEHVLPALDRLVTRSAVALTEEGEDTGPAPMILQLELPIETVEAAVGRATEFVCVNLAPAAPVSDQLGHPGTLACIRLTTTRIMPGWTGPAVTGAGPERSTP